MKLGSPEILIVTIIVLLVAVPIIAVKTKKQSMNYLLGLVVPLITALSDFRHGSGYVLGELSVFLALAVIVAVAYWAIAGRKTDVGQLRTSKIFFWLAFAMPLLERWSEALNR